MTTSVDFSQARTHLSKLVRRAEAGEEIIILRGRKPVARIAPLEKKGGGLRGRGSMKGKIRMGPDFDKPLEEFAEYER